MRNEIIKENINKKNILFNFSLLKKTLIKQYKICENTIIKKNGCVEKPKTIVIKNNPLKKIIFLPLSFIIFKKINILIKLIKNKRA